ncbi:MAG: type II toxin-antitoxin system HicB family antitoxin [Ruminococcus sp.]|jgi:predicted RNase H-like HicB family nuclease|nr:type II toxin-antitoxin system HicB family antitoxin [Ruminococcus sp.]
MKYCYYAILSPYKNSYLVRFPDLVGCNTMGTSLRDASEMAEDAASLWLCDREDKRLPIIPASEPRKSENSDEIIIVINIDTDSYRRKNDNRSVKKTLSIPNWLNEKAIKAHINFSSVLQEGLKQHLGIPE